MSAPTIAPPPVVPSPPRHSRWPLVAAICVAVIVLLAAAMLIYDHARRDQIAKGVTIDGVGVGGLSASAARAKIGRELIANLNQPVIVRSGSHHWTLTARGAALTVDADRMVAQALSLSRGGTI